MDPYKNDLKIRLQLALIAQPATFREWAEEFPELQIDAGDEMLSYQMHQREVCHGLSVTQQPWRRTEQGRPELFVEQLPLFKLGPNQWFDLRAWIVFHEPTRLQFRMYACGSRTISLCQADNSDQMGGDISVLRAPGRVAEHLDYCSVRSTIGVRAIAGGTESRVIVRVNAID